MPRAALFLDRDGIINLDYGYVHTLKDFHFVDGIFELVRMAQAAGLATFVITNQAGIGRGYYTEDEFYALNDYMIQQFQMRGLQIDKIYYCPHHPTEGLGRYLQECLCRKPKPGMILQASSEFDIDLHCSVLIGDKESDILAGKSAGVRRTIQICETASKHANQSFPSVREMVCSGFSFG